MIDRKITVVNRLLRYVILWLEEFCVIYREHSSTTVFTETSFRKIKKWPDSLNRKLEELYKKITYIKKIIKLGMSMIFW